MKKLLLIVGLITLALTGCKKEETAALLIDEIAVPGAKCEMCQATISAAVLKLDGVSKVDVDLDKKITTVAHTEKVSREDLEKAIAASGYDTGSHAKDSTAYENLPECCK